VLGELEGIAFKLMGLMPATSCFVGDAVGVRSGGVGNTNSWSHDFGLVARSIPADGTASGADMVANGSRKGLGVRSDRISSKLGRRRGIEFVETDSLCLFFLFSLSPA